MNVKSIYSRPRHPQPQGKVERCHRTLRSKMKYDLQKMDQDGVNWAKPLPLHQSILNNDPKEVIAFKTPFEIYFARKCNAFRANRLQDEILPSAGRVRLTENDRNWRSRQALKLWKQAEKATSRCDRRMQRTQLRLNPPSVCIDVWEGNYRINGMWRRVLARKERSSWIPITCHTPRLSRWDDYITHMARDYAVCSSNLV